MSEPFIGEIRMFGFNFPPKGWATCNGQLLPINQYEALFAILGTTYGGDGQTNFALPNLQSRVAIHQGTGPGLSTYIMGQTSGIENVTLTPAQMPTHTHLVQCNTGGGNQASPSGNIPAVESTGTSLDYSNAAGNGTMSPTMLGTQGGSQPHTNIQPYLCVNFCIALVGIFPSRN
ncbi:MAG TPA: tail fiber protein [Verrucomicrobiae bacterium]|jgi:microcystin-dependent protein|nr:tail fiber protein [Verrucomicrobiae bacterium]